MSIFRSPKYVQNIEDTVFELETTLVEPGNAAYQKKTGYRFVTDNSGELLPFDWFNARFDVDFKMNKLADAGNTTVATMGMVNGSYSIIKEILVKVNGKQVYENNNANQSTNIKSLLEFDPSYEKSTATNQFFYLDTSNTAATANTGFAARAKALETNKIVNAEVPLNRYSFFEAFEDKLMPNTKVEILVTLESDANLVFRSDAGAEDAANNFRIIITKFQLWVPKITFNPIGLGEYMSKYLVPHRWTYLRETIERSNSLQQQEGKFRITAGINRPRHVFVWILNDSSLDSQKKNMFLLNTFNVANNKTLENCHLIVGTGTKYPQNAYEPSTNVARVYRDVISYVHANNEFTQGTLLNISNFKTLFPFIYFDLTKQRMDIRDGTTSITFNYKLSEGTNADYSIYALVLYEQDIEITQSNGKLLLKS